jgi:hypothetical protein
MYELRRGSARLVSALFNVQNDDYTINRLANYLNYIPQQLREDIQALSDFMDEQRAKEQEE